MADQATAINGSTLDLTRGNQFFVRFPQSHGNTVYLYDKTKGMYVPFTSASSFTAFTGGQTPEQAYNSGLVYDFASPPFPGSFVPDQYGFQNDGHVPDNDPYWQNNNSSSSLASNYGKPKNSQMEQTASDQLGILFTTLKNQGAISQPTFDAYISNPTNLAKYISAWVYGGYNMDDIYRDIKAKETGTQGNGISSTQTAADYYKTPEYASVHNNTALNTPANLSVDPSFFKNPIFSIPGAAFKTLVPVLDVNSPDFKTQAGSIKDAYHDLILQQLDAKNVQEKAIADDNYKNFKEQLTKKYGITLSDNSTAAWGQIQQLNNSAQNANLGDSGIFNEAMDRTLAQRRTTDQRNREQMSTDADSAKRTYYTTQATADQIKNDLTPEEKKQWGLTPDQSTLDYVNGLAAAYPDLTSDQINNIKNTLVDENGNLRSSLYQNLYQNKYNTNQAKTTYQQQTLEAQKTNETNKAYEPYTKSDNPFIQYQGANPTLDTPAPATSIPPATTSNVPAGLQMPTQPTPTPAPAASSLKDLSSQYAMNGKTVYNLGTGLGYSKPEDFFKDAGVTDFNNVKFKTDYTPSFYKYNDAPLVYNAYNNKELDYNSYLQSGGKSDFSNVTTKNR